MIADRSNKLLDGRYLVQLACRLLGIASRFLVPLYLFTNNNISLLGEFYLISAIIAGYSVLGGAELSMYYGVKVGKVFSGEYLGIINLVRKASIFNLMLSPIVFALTYWHYSDVVLSFLIIFALGIEAVSYEIGRYLWNINRPGLISLRDLVRPVIFSFSVLLSVTHAGKVFELWGLSFFILANLCYLVCELTYLHQKNKKIKRDADNLGSTVFEFKAYARIVFPQFTQNQLLAYSLIAERLLFVNWGGTDFLGRYGFWYSIVSALGHVVCMPRLVALKALIVKSQEVLEDQRVYIECCSIIWIIVASCLIATVFALAGSYVFGMLGLQTFYPGLAVGSTVLISSVTYIYCGVVSAMYSHHSRFLAVQLRTLLCFSPIYLGMFVGQYSHIQLPMFALLMVVIASFALATSRYKYFKSRH